MMFAGFIIIFITFLFLRFCFNKRNDPPGPISLPLFGILWDLMRHKNTPFFLYLHRMGQKYGGIFSFYIGTQQFVILQSYSTIRETMLENAANFHDRPRVPYFKALSNDHNGIVMVSGEKWQNHRRFIMRVLRSFGLGRKSLEPKIIVEAEYMESLILESNNKPVDSSQIFAKGVSNIISLLIFGERWAYNDSNFLDYVDQIKKMTHAKTTDLIPLFFPFLGVDFVFNRVPIIYNVRKFRQTIKKKFEHHQSTYDTNDEPRDLIESYLQEKEKLEREDGSEIARTYNDEQIMAVCFDLVIGGTDTTTVALTWAMLLLSTHPKVQTRLHAEIDTVLGLDRVPNMADKISMPYVQAVIEEVLRYSSGTPLSLEKQVPEDTVYQGYTIRKSAIIFTNLYSVHRDPNLWEHPDEFNPERFLSADGKYQPNEHMIGFGLGKRSCIGESLSRMELFLIFTFLMQRFSVELNPDCKSHLEFILIGTAGIVRSPNEHKIIFHKRR